MKNLEKTTDLELIVHYQEHNDDAYFGELYRRFFPKIFKQSISRFHDREKAYEFTTNYFISLAQKVTTIRNPERILELIAINSSSDRLQLATAI